MFVMLLFLCIRAGPRSERRAVLDAEIGLRVVQVQLEGLLLGVCFLSLRVVVHSSLNCAFASLNICWILGLSEYLLSNLRVLEAASLCL